MTTYTSRWTNFSVKNLRTGQCVLIGSDDVLWTAQTLLDMTQHGRLTTRLGDQIAVMAQHYASDDPPEYWVTMYHATPSTTRVEKIETVSIYRLVENQGLRELWQVR